MQSDYPEDFENYGWAHQARGTFGGEALLGPDDLTATPSALVVLQAEPALSERTAAQTHQGMRAVAAELVASGTVGAVLVVPSAVDDRAQAAVEAVAAAVDRHGARPPHPLDLLETAADVQNKIGAHTHLYANTEQERTA